MVSKFRSLRPHVGLGLEDQGGATIMTSTAPPVKTIRKNVIFKQKQVNLIRVGIISMSTSKSLNPGLALTLPF